MMIIALLVLNCQVDVDSRPKSRFSLRSKPRSNPIILAKASDVISQFGYPEFEEFIACVGRSVAKGTSPGQRLTVQDEEFFNVYSYNRNGLCSLGFMDKNYPVPTAFSLLNKVLDEYENNFGSSWRNVPADRTDCLCNLLQISLIKLIQVLEYQMNFGKSLRTVQADDEATITQPWPYLNEVLTIFQDPMEAHKLLNIDGHEGDHNSNDDHQFDQTKIIFMSYIDKETLSILHKIVISLMERGEKLDSVKVVLNKIMNSLISRDRNRERNTGWGISSYVERSPDLSEASQVFYKEAAKIREKKKNKDKSLMSPKK